jgi:hypothetical protein
MGSAGNIAILEIQWPSEAERQQAGNVWTKVISQAARDKEWDLNFERTLIREARLILDQRERGVRRLAPQSDVGSIKVVWEYNLPDSDHVTGFELSPDERYVVLNIRERHLSKPILRLENPDRRYEISRRGTGSYTQMFSSDGRWLALVEPSRERGYRLSGLDLSTDMQINLELPYVSDPKSGMSLKRLNDLGMIIDLSELGLFRVFVLKSSQDVKIIGSSKENVFLQTKNFSRPDIGLTKIITVDLKTHTQKIILNTLEEVLFIEMDQAEGQLIVGTGTRLIIFDSESGEMIKLIRLDIFPTKYYVRASISKNQRYIVSRPERDFSSPLSVYDLHTKTQKSLELSSPGSLQSISHDSQWMITAHDGGARIELLNLPFGERVQSIFSQTSFSNVRLLNDSRRILVLDGKKKLKLIDLSPVIDQYFQDRGELE